ncbi:MAG: hypothetical protein PF444_05470 [Bacteroidales bacterium]|jgi:hypothetical protein|nr:hypothetical protein [Bacteroidales bacterium]
MEKQAFNLNSAFLGGYAGLFIKLVIAIIILYGFILLITFLRDLFVKKDGIARDPQIIDLLSILNKLFYFAGFGFVIGNILEVLLNEAFSFRVSLQVRGAWDSLTFGIIIIFIGIGFKHAQRLILKHKKD